MARKDFEIIARILAYISFCGDQYGKKLEDIHEGVDGFLETTNLNYDPSKFWSAVDKNYKNYMDIIEEE